MSTFAGLPNAARTFRTAGPLARTIGTPAGTPRSLAAEARNPKQAALFYEAAARAYLRGTLGLMSRKPWASAKECYQRLGDELNVAKCDRLRAAIPAYWDDDDQSPPETALMSD